MCLKILYVKVSFSKFFFFNFSNCTIFPTFQFCLIFIFVQFLICPILNLSNSWFVQFLICPMFNLSNFQFCQFFNFVQFSIFSNFSVLSNFAVVKKFNIESILPKSWIICDVVSQIMQSVWIFIHHNKVPFSVGYLYTKKPLCHQERVAKKVSSVVARDRNVIKLSRGGQCLSDFPKH